MQSAQILTPWTGSGTASDPLRPLVADTYVVSSWSDVTSTPANKLPIEPDFVQTYIEAGDAVMDDIVNDNDFVVVLGPTPV